MERNFIRKLGNESGVAYLALLFAITVIGISLAAAGEVWSNVAKHEKEEELLFRGLQIRSAIAKYHEEKKRYPKTFDELLQDSSSLTAKRYLRKLYNDPMTGKPDWAIVTETGGGMAGVKSKSTDETLKREGFPVELADFAGKSSYKEWVFVYYPKPKQAQPGTQAAPAAAPPAAKK